MAVECGRVEARACSVFRLTAHIASVEPQTLHFSINDINGLVAIVLSRGVLQVEKGHSLVPKVKCQIY